MDDKEKLEQELIESIAKAVNVPEEYLQNPFPTPPSVYNMGIRMTGNKITGIDILNPRTRS